MPNAPQPRSPERSEAPNIPSSEVVQPPVTTSPERIAGAGDRVNQGGPTQIATGVPTDLPQPISSTPVPPAGASNDDKINLTTMPPVADDVDVIEKAWVQKAKEIVEQTKDDPHAQEEEVSKLQTDYKTKRFGDTTTSNE